MSLTVTMSIDYCYKTSVGSRITAGVGPTEVSSALELFALVMDVRSAAEDASRRFLRLSVYFGKSHRFGFDVYEDMTGEQTDERVFEAWGEWHSYQQILAAFHSPALPA
jgi:hypothetical protein